MVSSKNRTIGGASRASCAVFCLLIGACSGATTKNQKTVPWWLDGLTGFATVNAWGQDGTTGGLGGPTVTARSTAELVQYISQEGPLVIQVEGTIDLPIDLTENGAPAHGMNFVRSHKTIVGIGQNPTIRAGGLGLGLYYFDDSVTTLPANATKNVIIRNLTFDGTGGVLGETDGVNIFMFTHHVWVDRCTFINSLDGSLDIKRGASFVTVSNNLFIQQEQACMLGHKEGPTAQAQDTGNLKVTYHHNWFRDCTYRMPLVRFGEAHVYNNYWSNVGWHAIGVGEKSSIYSENNQLDTPPETGTFSYVFYEDGALLDLGSEGGTSHNLEGVTWKPTGYYPYTAEPTASVKSSVMENAGAGTLASPSRP